MKILFLVIFTVIFIFSSAHSVAKTKNLYFNEGKKLFENKKYKKSKFYYEKDIVFNPKSENSYLYLAKIFKEEKNDNLEENNLNTVLLLNPKNEEAVYLLTLFNIRNSNFSKAEELMNTLNLICKKMCSSKQELKLKLSNSLKSK